MFRRFVTATIGSASCRPCIVHSSFSRRAKFSCGLQIIVPQSANLQGEYGPSAARARLDESTRILRQSQDAESVRKCLLLYDEAIVMSQATFDHRDTVDAQTRKAAALLNLSVMDGVFAADFLPVVLLLVDAALKLAAKLDPQMREKMTTELLLIKASALSSLDTHDSRIQAVAVCDEVLALCPSSAAVHAVATMVKATVYHAMDDKVQALGMYDEAISACRALNPTHQAIHNALRQQAEILGDLSRLDASIKVINEALAMQQPDFDRLLLLLLKIRVLTRKDDAVSRRATLEALHEVEPLIRALGNAEVSRDHSDCVQRLRAAIEKDESE